MVPNQWCDKFFWSVSMQEKAIQSGLVLQFLLLTGTTIRFEQSQYNISEGDQLTICAVLSQTEELQGDVEVIVNSSDITATGMHM